MKITVIIPTLNEEATIRQVIQLIKQSPLVDEIIIVDDKSVDNTVEKAKEEHVKVITSTMLGKGASMRDGLLVAKGEIIIYLDADITTYPVNIIKALTDPIIYDEADFVKACFERQAGRVTELVAKPLLSILFPDLSNFQQPLSGMIAGKKELLKEIDFENDYGVDIGILIDMYKLGAKIKEVNIGAIQNRMRPLAQLGKMSKEVTTAILKRSGNTDANSLAGLEKISIIREQMDFAIKDSVNTLKKMAIFNMDNTILKGSFIHTLAERKGFKKELQEIIVQTSNPFIRTKKIALLLKGINIADILKTLDDIPFADKALEVIQHLKRQGYITGIISDSYDCVTNHLKTKLGMDFSIANELEFSKSISTGEVRIPSYFLKTKYSECEHEYCKSNVLHELTKRYNINIENVMAVGDSDADICMVHAAGIGVVFCSDNKILQSIADYCITEASFQPLLQFIR